VLVLGVETSCDETAAAVVEDGRRVRADVVASQIKAHAPYGGVVPEVASRQHVATIVPVIRRAIADAGITFAELDAIAVTAGPGLVGALLVGVETAKALAFALGKPLVAVNHLAGHLAAARLIDPHRDPGRAPKPSRDGSRPGEPAGTQAIDPPSPDPPPYPHLALLVSGGHTALIRVDAPGETRLLGATRDDAAGEAFDKVGKLLGLGYPGGVAIDRLAAAGNRQAVALPRALPGRDDLDFSFSGLKTAVATLLAKGELPRDGALADFCASFQAAVVDVLVRKSRRALAREGLGALVVCGGVAANRGLRAALADAAREDGFALFIPPPKYCTDNAAMIAAAGSELHARGVTADLDLAVDPGLPLSPGPPLSPGLPLSSSPTPAAPAPARLPSS
jgi:N6-L-threonylcarbamoyladenine synthase